MRRRLSLLFSYILCLSVLSVGLSSSIKAETSDSFAGHWYVWEENENVSGNQWISYQNVLIVTNDPLAMGQVQVNNTTSGQNNFVQTLDFAGTYTFYSHRFEQPFTLSNGLMPVATSNSRAFTSYTPIQSAHNVEVVQLSSTQIQSLITAINNSSSYDDTDLLNILAVINGVLDNIDNSTSVTASDIAALNTTASNIYTSIQNIDNALDMISWITYNVSATLLDSSFNEIDISQSYYPGGTYYLVLNMPSNYLPLGILVNAIGYYTTTNQTTKTFALEIGQFNTGNNKFYSSGNVVLLGSNSYGKYNVMFDLSTGLNTAAYKVCLKITAEQNWRSSANITLKSIGYDDIEYWQLKQVMLFLQSQQNQQTIIINQQNQNNYQQQPYDNDNNTEQTDEINDFIVDYDNKLGFIGQTFDFISSLFGVITSADESATIPFPGVTVPIGENGSDVTLLAAQNVPIVPQGLSSIFETVKLANSMILVSAVFNMAINKYKEWSMK